MAPFYLRQRRRAIPKRLTLRVVNIATDVTSEIPYRLSEIRYATDTFRADNLPQFVRHPPVAPRPAHRIHHG